MTDFNKVKHLILPGSALSDAIASKKNPLGVAGMVADAFSKVGGSNQAESEAPLFTAAEDADEGSDVDSADNSETKELTDIEIRNRAIYGRRSVINDDGTISVFDGNGKLLGTYTQEEYNNLPHYLY